MAQSEQSMRWESRLHPQGRVLVETRRQRYVQGYNYLREQGYYVVGEVAPTSGRLLRRGRAGIVSMIQEVVAREEIQRIEEQDAARKQRRTYEWTKGAVVPIRKHMDPATISLSHHIHAYQRGVTIFAREDMLAELSVESRIDELIASALPSREDQSIMPNMLQSLS